MDFIEDQEVIDQYFLHTLRGYRFPKRFIMQSAYEDLCREAVHAKASKNVIDEILIEIHKKNRSFSIQE
jgi:hypothetical protein